MNKIPTKKIFPKGFTLLELLIAIAVFAVMSAMAYGGLRSVISNSAHSKTELERIHAVQYAMSVMSRDLTQIVSRNIRDEFGNTLPYLTTSNIDFLIEFTRGGYRNPAVLKRSNMLRVTYKHEDKTLVRLYWPQLDRVQGMEPYERVLLTGVSQIELKYLDDSGDWQTQWPPNNNQAGTPVPRPTAIELKINLEDWGEVTRLFRINT